MQVMGKSVTSTYTFLGGREFLLQICLRPMCFVRNADDICSMAKQICIFIELVYGGEEDTARFTTSKQFS